MLSATIKVNLECQPPNVTNSVLFSATLGNEKVLDVSWSKILQTAYCITYHFLQKNSEAKEDTIVKLTNATNQKIIIGESPEPGMVFISKIGISIQGRSASAALKNVVQLARVANFPIVIDCKISARDQQFSGNRVHLWWTPTAYLDAILTDIESAAPKIGAHS